MKKNRITGMLGILMMCIVLICCTALTCAAEESAAGAHEHQWVLSEKESTAATCEKSGTNVYRCTVEGCSATRKEGVPSPGHSYGDWVQTKAATCAESGSETRTCSVCGKQDTRVISRTDEHTWSEPTVSVQPTCLVTGMETRRCTVCGKVKNNSIDRLDHQWSDWETKKEPTCTEKGKRQRVCSLCGSKENQVIKPLGHETENWTIMREPTCRVVGEKEGTCDRCGKKLYKKINRVDHEYDEGEILEEATEFSKGKRRSVCRFCSRKKTEEFYPDGTLARSLDNSPEEIEALQTALAALGLYKKDVNGKYDNATAEAVRKAEKGLGLKQDGICWTGLRKILGLGTGGEEWEGGNDVNADEEKGAGPDPAKYKLQLVIRQTSPKKDFYSAGDEITYEWTLTNTSRSVCLQTKILHFEINGKLAKQKETAIEDVGKLKSGESATGTFTYTVTTDGMTDGKIRHGFIARGKIGGKASSNPHFFTYFIGILD